MCQMPHTCRSLIFNRQLQLGAISKIFPAPVLALFPNGGLDCRGCALLTILQRILNRLDKRLVLRSINIILQRSLNDSWVICSCIKALESVAMIGII